MFLYEHEIDNNKDTVNNSNNNNKVAGGEWMWWVSNITTVVEREATAFQYIMSKFEQSSNLVLQRDLLFLQWSVVMTQYSAINDKHKMKTLHIFLSHHTTKCCGMVINKICQCS